MIKGGGIDGGGREWWTEGVVESEGGGRDGVMCRVLERGNSPGLIVARVRLLLPMSAHHFSCP